MFVSLDTNIFISISKHEFDWKECKLIIDMISKKDWQCGISVIVLAELLVGVYKDKKVSEAELLDRKMNEIYTIFSLSKESIHLGAKYRAEMNLKLPDALIIGSAICHKVDYLISRDIAGNKRIPLKIVTPKEFVDLFITNQTEENIKKK